jgi:hypothetical protein
MAEAVRRFQTAGSPDLVRRLMARPVRLAHQARTRLPEREAAGATPAVTAEAEVAAPDLGRLETELEVLKAILRAQRKEVESLRAQRQLLTESSPDDDVRATRERWAALVDSLLVQPR